MKKEMLWILLFCLMAVVFFAVQKNKDIDNGYTSISMEEAINQWENEEEYILLDVRTWTEYDEGHIPGAICIPNENIKTQEPEELPNKEQRIYVYCRSGNRSKRAADKLSKLGYQNIIEIGGILNWTGEIKKS